MKLGNATKESIVGFCTLSIIPVDPQFEPSPDAVKRAVLLMERYFPYPRNYDIRVYRSAHPRFFTEGDGFEEFTCPVCKKTTTYHEFNAYADDEDAWYYFVETSEGATDATTHSIEMPCCKSSVFLSDLILPDDSGAGISRFRISLTEVEDALSEEEKNEIEKALGCNVVQMMAWGT